MLRGPKRGRLVFVGVSHGNGVVWFSDDGGESYSLSNAPHLEGTNEAMLVELHSSPRGLVGSPTEPVSIILL